MSSASERPPLVLVVDDEPVILDVSLAVLTDGPWRVRGASTLVEARGVLDAETVDVLVADKNLPDGNGLDLLRRLKAQDPLAEGILVTGYPSVETAVQAIGHDVFDYLVKPMRDVHDLRRRVLQALDKRRVALQNRALLEELTRTNDALRAALEEARALQDELVQSEKLAALGTLAAGVGHEVASPLFGILGLAEAITDEPDLPVAQAHAREIVSYCGHIREILGDLARHARDAQHDPLEPVEVGEVAGEAARLVARVHPSVNVCVEGRAWAHVRAGELRQICVNLIRNAADAAAEAHVGGGGVRVRVERRDSLVDVRVSDDGRGVPPEARRRLFEPFYTTKPPGRGTGLGLHVVWRIVGRLGGSVALLEDSPGATFLVRLPAADP